jgi:hypothetical protein
MSTIRLLRIADEIPEDVFDELISKMCLTKHPDVFVLQILDYRTSINLLASFGPSYRKQAEEIHKGLSPLTARVKHVTSTRNECALMWCGAFAREGKKQGGKRHTITWVFFAKSESGIQYLSEKRAEHLQMYRQHFTNGGDSIEINPNN